MSYSTDPAKDWDRWIARQESTHGTAHQVDRILETLKGERGFFEAEIGEYGYEAELLADLIHTAVQQANNNVGDARDIEWRALSLAYEIIQNRDSDYWSAVDENQRRKS